MTFRGLLSAESRFAADTDNIAHHGIHHLCPMSTPTMTSKTNTTQPYTAYTAQSHPPAKLIHVSYSIHPSDLIPTLPLTSTTDYPLDHKHAASFYSTLSQSVLLAQRELNANLTKWKDAIGDAERVKETGKQARRQTTDVRVSPCRGNTFRQR